MPPKKGKSRLPSIDRSRALPVRTGISFKRTLALGLAVGVAVWIFHGPSSEVPAPQAPTQVVSPQ